MPAWMVVSVLGGATTIAPALMASISLDFFIEGAHDIFTGKMLHIRIVRGTKEYRMGHVGLLWTGMSIYDDFSEHGLEGKIQESLFKIEF